MLPVRALAGVALLAVIAGCSAETNGEEGVVGGDEAALSALEGEIGFEGAIERLDEAALVSIDQDLRALEDRGEATAPEIEQVATRKALSAALKKGRGLRTSTLRTLDVSRPASGGSATTTAQSLVYDSDLFKLNGLEKALCKAHRIVCVRVAIAAFKARGGSQAAYRDGNVGGRIDCFRHTYWNAAMTRSVGSEHAKAWADAHENGYPQNRATPKDRVLSDMDFFNNDVGRTIGRAHEDSSDDETKDAVREALTKGDVRAVRYDLGDRNGKLVPASQCTDTVKCGG